MITRATRRLDVVARLAEDEPRTTIALAEVASAARESDVRVLRVGPGGRSWCPLVRSEPAVWTAYPFLADPGDAAALGRAIDRSPALAVEGAPADVDPVVAHMDRRGPAGTIPRISLGDVPWPAPDDRTRMATPLDVAALCDVFEGYELQFGRTRRGLRRLLERAVGRFGVIVADDPSTPGRLLGATVSSGVTPRYVVWGDLTVRPSARRSGIAWALVDRGIHVSRAAGLEVTALKAASNPMELPDGIDALARNEEHRIVVTSLPDRWPGERRVRRAWWRLDRTRPRRPW